jgi:hypothetical protein
MAAFVAVAFALVVALAASRWFPVGIAADIDPDRGVHADWTVLAIGLALTLVFVVAVVAVSSYRAAGFRSAGLSSSTARFVDRVQRRTPVSVGVGTALVMERGRARVNVPIRQAIVGAVVGVVGVVATLTINANLHDAIDHPERAGVTYDIQVFVGDEAPVDTTFEPLLTDFRARPDIAAIAAVQRVLITVDDIGIPTFTVESLHERSGESIAFTLIDGR